MAWSQIYTPVGGSLALSALVALIPILYFFWALAVKRMKGHIAGSTTLLVAVLVAMVVYGMPAGMAVMSAVQGAVYGVIPIGWIIIASVFLYKLTVKSGQFDIIRASVVSVTEDRRLQALLIAFSFGAFLEGAAGFGAPVAISAALLVGLGFHPIYAAGICLLANTAPVAFGAIGTPIIAVSGPTGIPAMDISQIVGRQLPLLSIFVPFYLVVLMCGFRRTLEVMPAILVSGISFACTQFITSNYMGPELPDILSALVSMVCLTLLLKVWQPASIFRFQAETAGMQTAPSDQAGRLGKGSRRTYTAKQVLYAWSPFLVLTALISLWGVPSIKKALIGKYEGANALLSAINPLGKALSFYPPVPGLNQLVIGANGKPIEALFKLELLVAAGTAILFAAVITKFIARISWKEWGKTFGETLRELRFAITTIAAVVGFAYVANASGMSTTLGMALAATGVLFPFFAPMLGWLGVFLTGSDTSSNLLFGNLQKVTATQLGMSPALAIAANSSGGVTGKMISPQSIAVACAAVGLAGKDAELFRFTFKHSILLLLIICVLTYLQTNVLSWMLP
ncbi:lactate permease LctP family transporter [Brevibacillus sp. SYP-B805]|uniref:L-lactate permease n=1 Tax=Brevibacillus sp. SYP-B805 TaxID=1578199 RepID=UPI0013EA309D|nr:lactate permease LctP family transporter [Brevibacillus sp. SYP-B805]NGQ96690.1 lactate permease LctP family transporter [Brevibacillus sp. SYP-B805]